MLQERHLLIYQVRVAKSASARVIVTKLAGAVWRALEEAGGADPRRLPKLHEAFDRVFKNRLSLYEGCGSLDECRFSMALDGQSAVPNRQEDIYILTLRGGLVHFTEGLAALAWRRLRGGFNRKDGAGRGQRDQIKAALHRALAEHLYYNEACSQCRLRKAGVSLPSTGLASRRMPRNLSN